ncbi:MULTISPECIES: permease-like cell division protein FtsX [Clostridium]|uniref:permease-like cell division protein FtsX n=1 Tax=Clostridium TaxID=1485 RepID=UPI000AFA470A|nr:MULTISPECIES: permease-like cell division protein FtsX [Clostridium]
MCNIHYFLSIAIDEIKSKWKMFLGVTFICISVFILISVFYFNYINSKHLLDKINNKTEVIITLKNSYTKQDKKVLKNYLNEAEFVAKYKEIGKNELKKDIQNNLISTSKNLSRGISSNSLKVMYVIKLNNINKINNIKLLQNQFKFIDKVEVLDEIIDQLIKICNIINKVNIVFLIIFMCTIIILFSNTNKIIFENRKNDINILNQLGASKLFINNMFLIKTLLITIISILITYYFSIYGYSMVYKKISMELPFISMVPPSNIKLQYLFMLLIIGLLISIITSIRSINKLLK